MTYHVPCGTTVWPWVCAHQVLGRLPSNWTEIWICVTTGFNDMLSEPLDAQIDAIAHGTHRDWKIL